MIAAAQKFHATFLSGWWRWRREHFSVWVGRDPAELHRVPAPWGSYYADPFPWVNEGRLWLFLEEFRYSANRGRLVALALDDAFRPVGTAKPLGLPIDVHSSYPLLFAHEGELFLLPETGAAGCVDVFVCESFPLRWKRRRRLLENIDAVDATPLPHAGRWWLFTSVRGRPGQGGHRNLAIFSANSLLDGDWEAHPINTKQLHADSPVSYGRPAGPFVATRDGEWLRPMQSSRRYYGESIQWMRIEELSRTTFRESPASTDTVRALMPRLPLSPHHVASHGDIIACDVRDRFPGPVG